VKVVHDLSRLSSTGFGLHFSIEPFSFCSETQIVSVSESEIDGFNTVNNAMEQNSCLEAGSRLAS
jgi:hypothetical protein